MISGLFKRESAEAERQRSRVPRHSSGWKMLQERLSTETGLRIMDVGPTSSQNINLLTGMGHSVYMADLVADAFSPEFWKQESPEAAKGSNPTPVLDEDRFFEQETAFRARIFDCVLLWTTLDFLPEPLIEPLVERIYDATEPGSQVFLFFHTRKGGNLNHYCRYHLTDRDAVEMQALESHPIERIYTNRAIEKLFGKFSSYRFFLAKDDLYEALITR